MLGVPCCLVDFEKISLFGGSGIFKLHKMAESLF